jgi:predicted nuclease with TOPRIM domain
MGKDFLEKNEENSDFGPRSKQDKQNIEISEMQNFISELTAEKNQLLSEKDELISEYSRISQRLQSISSDNEKLINIVEEKNKYISKLKRDIELSSQYSQEESKPTKSDGELQEHPKYPDSYSKEGRPT